MHIDTNLRDRYLITRRWFPIPQKVIKHPVQEQLNNDLYHHKYINYIIAAGRRSYKTERFGKRFLMSECLRNDNHYYYAGAPTRMQAKEILWKDLKSLVPKWAVKKIEETALKIYFRNGTELRVVGLKEFRRVQGNRCNGFLITEYQDCDPESYNESIEPMLNDTGGWCIKEGRPFGKNHFFDDFLKGKMRHKGWASYHWKSEDILTPGQIERAKENLSRIDYEREYEASFETGNQKPYYGFCELNNKRYELNENLPVIVTCDFNATVKPMSWVVGQRVNEYGADITYWVKSLSYQYTGTKAMCEVLDEDFLCKLSVYPKHLIFYGDYAGKKKTSNSDYSDWQIIENYFRNKCRIEFRLKPCNSVKDSIAATNGQLCNSMNQRRQFIDMENCKELVKDWEYCEWKENGKELSEKDDLRTHCCRAVDYYNDFEHSVKKNEGKQW
ncbi:MAG: hypothetical protein EHM58_03280 [Ignavibacteriae bacterium]|nr:MAG: hypothetical protein EHM58_03280 [Ignavibacteriota bacterium]